MALRPSTPAAVFRVFSIYKMAGTKLTMSAKGMLPFATSGFYLFSWSFLFYLAYFIILWKVKISRMTLKIYFYFMIRALFIFKINGVAKKLPSKNNYCN